MTCLLSPASLSRLSYPPLQVEALCSIVESSSSPQPYLGVNRPAQRSTTVPATQARCTRTSHPVVPSTTALTLQLTCAVQPLYGEWCSRGRCDSQLIGLHSTACSLRNCDLTPSNLDSEYSMDFPPDARVCPTNHGGIRISSHKYA